MGGKLIRGLNTDPLITCGLLGFVWPIIQAGLDEPLWTAAQRHLVVLAAGLVRSVLIRWVGVYPPSWQLVATQTSVVSDATSTDFSMHKGIGVIDRVDYVTPGGEPYQVEQAEKDGVE